MLIMYSDKIQGNRTKALGDVTKKFADAIKQEGLQDIVTLNWWSYSDVPEKIKFTSMGNGLGLRSLFAPPERLLLLEYGVFPLADPEHEAIFNILVEEFVNALDEPEKRFSICGKKGTRKVRSQRYSALQTTAPFPSG